MATPTDEAQAMGCFTLRSALQPNSVALRKLSLGDSGIPNVAQLLNIPTSEEQSNCLSQLRRVALREQYMARLSNNGEAKDAEISISVQSLGFSFLHMLVLPGIWCGRPSRSKEATRCQDSYKTMTLMQYATHLSLSNFKQTNPHCPLPRHMCRVCVCVCARVRVCACACDCRGVCVRACVLSAYREVNMRLLCSQCNVMPPGLTPITRLCSHQGCDNRCLFIFGVLLKIVRCS
eukprot:6469333-Amphidinium_carterae.1